MTTHMKQLTALFFYIGWGCMEAIKFFTGITTDIQAVIGLTGGVIVTILYVVIVGAIDKRKEEKNANDNIL